MKSLGSVNLGLAVKSGSDDKYHTQQDIRVTPVTNAWAVKLAILNL